MRSKVNRPPAMRTVVSLFGSILFILIGFWFYQENGNKTEETGTESLDSFPAQVPTVQYGFAIDTFVLQWDTIRRNEFLGQILNEKGISYLDIDRLSKNAEDVFDVRKIREGRPYLFLYTDTTRAPDYLVYEPSAYEYVVYELKDSLQVRKEKRPIEKVMRTFYGEIQTSLWDAVVGRGLNWDLAVKMEDALQWQVDFHHLQTGDQFRMVYEEDLIEGKSVGIGRVWAAGFKNSEHEYQAVYFDHEKRSGYYDPEGRPMEAPFLKAPVKYTRISSRYNPRRFHPILKRVRPHYGTDYSAPRGTPIYAVGNGTVIEAAYSKGNGNYVKIRHDKTYMTQYLHMQGFARGIRAGLPVRQGQVIGYVGSTGLATGPHVCFRFWKNGRQVNHLRLSFPPSEPLPEELLPAFRIERDRYLQMLNGIEIPEPEVQPDSLLISENQPDREAETGLGNP